MTVTVESIYTAAIGGLAFVGTLGAALAVIHRWVYKPWIDAMQRRFGAQINVDLQPVLDKLEDIEADVADIRHEVNTNNGRSLKDVALQTRGRVDTLTARFEDHLESHHQGGTR